MLDPAMLEVTRPSKDEKEVELAIEAFHLWYEVSDIIVRLCAAVLGRSDRGCPRLPEMGTAEARPSRPHELRSPVMTVGALRS